MDALKKLAGLGFGGKKKLVTCNLLMLDVFNSGARGIAGGGGGKGGVCLSCQLFFLVIFFNLLPKVIGGGGGWEAAPFPRPLP